MAEIKQGNVTMKLADDLRPPPEAGRLTPEQVQALPKARAGIGVACAAAAAALENPDIDFTPPKGVTAKSLRTLGERAERIDLAIKDAELLLQRLKQANFLFDAEALAALGKVNDQVKVQGKRDAAVRAAFAAVSQYYGNTPPKKQRAGG